jgi:hypothetical protein
MYTPDYSISSIPRSHFKWAGIRKVEPISCIAFKHDLSYKVPTEDVVHQSERNLSLARENDIEPPDKTMCNQITDQHHKTRVASDILLKIPEIVCYNKKGTVIKADLISKVVIFC